MDGQDHPGAGRQGGVHVDHRALQDVGRAALDRHVHRDALGRAPELAVAAGDLRHAPAAVEHRGHDAGLARRVERPVEVRADGREPFEVRVDERLRRFLGDADVLRQREGGLAVEQGVVDDLRPPAQLVRVESAVGAEDVQRRPVVDVLAPFEGVLQVAVAGEVRQHAQLDLRVVGRDQDRPGRGGEGGADLPADGGADGDVLQVRSVAAEAPGRGHRLAERRVQASGVRIDELRQRVGVGPLELRQRPPFQHLARQLVRRRQFLEDFDRRRRRLRLAGAFRRRELQLLEEDGRELPRRVDVEGLAGQGVYFGLQRRQLRVHRHRLRGQRAGVEADAGPFQIDEHRDERQLEVAVQPLEAVAGEARDQPLGRLQRQVAPFAGVLDHRVDRHVGEAGRPGALSDDFLQGDRLVADLLQGEVPQVVARAGGVQQVAGDQRVEVESGERDAVASEDQRGLLQVVADLRQAGVGQRLPEGVERGVPSEAGVRAEGPVSERHVPGVPRTGGQREPDQLGAHRVRPVGHHREADRPGASGRVEQRGEVRRGPHDAVVLLDGRRRRRVLGDEGPEAERREEREAALRRRAAVPQRVRLERDGHVRPDGDQLAAAARVVGVLLQRGPVPFLLDVGGALQQRVEGAVRRDQLAGALLADARDPLDVVDRVAHQRQHVDHPAGRDAELLPHSAGVVPRAGVARVEDAHAVADELEEVLVAGDDGHVVPGRAGLFGERPDDVVRLEPRVGQHRHAEGFARLAHPRRLFDQVGGHRRPVRLVVGGERGPEGRPPHVEGGGDQRRLVVGDQLAQHRDEAVDGVRGPAVGRAQPAYRVVRAVHLGAAVDQEDGVAGAHRGPGSSRSGRLGPTAPRCSPGAPGRGGASPGPPPRSRASARRRGPAPGRRGSTAG